MCATEDDSHNLDAGWDEESPSEEEDVDSAWDSVPAPVTSAPTPSVAPASAAVATEEVDEGWGDVPAGAPVPGGKRRPHRQRRAKSAAAATAANPVLLPRPAEPSKKHQRAHARQQRLHEAK